MNPWLSRFCNVRSTIQTAGNRRLIRSVASSAVFSAKAPRITQSQKQGAKKMSSPIDLTQSDGEDEDLKRAIALSLEETRSVDSPAKPFEIGPPEPAMPTSAIGTMGIDRKQMEQERLARLKRKRGQDPISPPPLRRTKSPPIERPTINILEATTETSTSKPSNPNLQYPNGILLRTWSSSYPDSPRSISFSSLVDAKNLQSALLSSYIWDFDWLFQQFETQRTKFLLVMHAHHAQHRAELRQDFDIIPNVRLCFPSTEGIVNCMHSKLMLLFYEGRCRVVVPTANLMNFDWGEMGGVMENMVFVIDLPLRDRACTEEQEHPFYSSLVQFLKAQGVPADLLKKLGTFNFSATEGNGIAFVHTMGGAHTQDDVWRSTGHCGLGRTVTEMGLRPAKGEIEIDFVTSSVGSLTDEFMRSLYLAAMGDDGMTELGIRQGKTSKVKGAIDSFFKSHKRKDSQEDDNELEKPMNGNSTAVISSDQAESWRQNFRFFFPSHATVASSIGGTDAAGTICFQRRWWDNAAKFPRASMRDCISVREGLLMHSKIMFVRYNDKESQEASGLAGWVYVGSANLSESAWGRLVVDKTKKSVNEKVDVKLNCRNWECGVVMPVATLKDAKGELDVFDGVIPIPMSYPSRRYEENKLEPWFFGKEGMAA